EIGVDGLLGVVHTIGAQGLLQVLEQLVQAGAGIDGHVINLGHSRLLLYSGQDIHLNNVVDKAEITAGLPVPIDLHILVLDHGRHPFGNHRGVCTVRVLTFAKHVEVTQAHAGEAVGTGKHVRIQLVHELGDGVRGQWATNRVFNLGQTGVIAVGGTGSRINKGFNLFVTCGHHHVQGTIHVDFVGGQ